MNNNVAYSDYPSRKSSYITEDGKFINLQENKAELIGYQSREVTHTDYVHYLHNQGKRIKDFNLIKVNDGTYIYINEHAYINISSKSLNAKQINALQIWLDHVLFETKQKYVFVYIPILQYSQEFKINRDGHDGMLPEDIIKEIKKLYNTQK